MTRPHRKSPPRHAIGSPIPFEVEDARVEDSVFNGREGDRGVGGEGLGEQKQHGQWETEVDEAMVEEEVFNEVQEVRDTRVEVERDHVREERVLVGREELEIGERDGEVKKGGNSQRGKGKGRG